MVAGTEALASGHLEVVPQMPRRKAYKSSVSHRQIILNSREPQGLTELEGNIAFGQSAQTGKPTPVTVEWLNDDQLSRTRAHNEAHPLSGPLKDEHGGLQQPPGSNHPSIALFQNSQEEENKVVDQEAPAAQQGRTKSRLKRRLLRLRRALTKPFGHMRRAAVRLGRTIGNFLHWVVRRFLKRTTSSHFSKEEPPLVAKWAEGTAPVARAVKRALGTPVSARGNLADRTLAIAQDLALEVPLPRGKRIIFESLRARRNVALERGDVLGEGGFGTVLRFMTSQGAQYAGKFFRLFDKLEQLQKRVLSQLAILNRLPLGTDVWSATRRLQLVLPLDILRKKGAGNILHVPRGKDLLNAMIVTPLFPMDLSRLVDQLVAKRAEDRVVLLSLTQQVVTAVNNLHGLGLIHLDVKPCNFLVSNSGRVYLADLDDVQEIGSPVLPAIFSPEYASPELARVLIGEDRGGKRSTAMDAWQLGVSIYAMWCRGLPRVTRSASGYEVMRAVVELSDATATLDPRCTVLMPEPVLDLVTQFLEINPMKRLTPAEAVASHPAMSLGVQVNDNTEQEKEPVSRSSRS